jgi:hypothetical protein
MFGPFNRDAAYRTLAQSLIQGSVVFGAAVVAIRLAGSRPFCAAACALLISSADLGIANMRHILTVPQSLLETRPKVLEIIEAAERDKPNPSSGPYRIHRMPSWDPPAWSGSYSDRRIEELVVWERDTLQPKHGINLGVEYTHTMGVAELYDYEWYFGGFLRKVRSPEMARALAVELGEEVVYFPRRSFDMWNTRYFIVPMYAHGWKDEFRGFASFLLDTEVVYPDIARFRGPRGADAHREFVENHDFQVLRNLRTAPRAWIVHDCKDLEPVSGLSRDSRKSAMQEICYEDDPLWHDPDLRAYNPFERAWIEKHDLAALSPFLPRGLPRSSEKVAVTYPSPQRAELVATLESPGIVVLADVYYPGWKLTIDGQPAPIYRINRVMRGAAVPAGRHHLVYSYEDAPSFRAGRVVSIAGLSAMALLALAFFVRPVDPTLSALAAS